MDNARGVRYVSQVIASRAVAVTAGIEYLARHRFAVKRMGEITVKTLEAIKTFFERADKFAPDGGRKITMEELRGVSADDRRELATLACKELGVEYLAA